MDIGYYPGCALHGSSNDYEQSLRACLDSLQVHLREVDDWVCCGATAAHSLNHKLSLALPARTLGLAQRDGLNELFAPCPLCSMRLLNTQTALADGHTRQELSEIVAIDLQGDTQVLNLIQVFERIGLERLKSRATARLESLRVACYYGCLLTRPPRVVRFDDCEQPRLGAS